jgi:hypothetical protein
MTSRLTIRSSCQSIPKRSVVYRARHRSTLMHLLLLALACFERDAQAETSFGHVEVSEKRQMIFFPRFTLVEAQYPQGIAASIGSWILLPSSREFRMGGVADFELGLSGSSLALGVGTTSSPTRSYETGSSFGVQGVLHRTWAWWTPWLSRSASYAGAEVFASYFAFRCTAGVLWPVRPGEPEGAHLMGGCGLGSPQWRPRST